jgi:hypothetical protein
VSADLSRVRFDPLRDHAGVVLQQGRLLLDADWNEQVALVDRRLRAQVTDLVPGKATASGGTATVSALTPAAFQVTPSGGTLSIGAGRMYVDGLLAENHGDPVDGFDPVLAGRAGTKPVDYAEQPYWPTPDALPTGGTAVAYLDVWQREVTPLQAGDLIEPAVGVDTTGRAQTVWQVRLLTGVDPATDCQTPLSDIKGWTELTAPSAARLTTGTVPVDAGDDVCTLPPSGGYRGPENQTYRIELHAIGDGAKVPTTFKWSRDNASVGSAVVQVVSGTQLVLASLGRDDVLRFNNGDWVEITDDHREFNRLAGELRQVTVDDATSTVTFSPALPADLVPSGTDPDTAAVRHLRVVRWDQSGQVRTVDGTLLVDLDLAGASGDVPVPADGSAVVLERGVTVAFSFPDSGTGRFGDHWIAAARTSDASIQTLDAAPPLGIHHHYARLAVLSLPDDATDCRLPDPVTGGGDGCACADCEVCVTEESHKSGKLTIQDAVRLLSRTGGTVVICPGTYVLREPLRLDRARSLTVRGAGPTTVLISDGPAVVATSAQYVLLQGVRIVAGRTPVAVRLTNCLGVELRGVTVTNRPTDPAIVAVAIGLAGITLFTTVRECQLRAPVGVGAVPPEESDAPGNSPKDAKTTLLTSGLRILDNAMQCGQRGIDLTGTCLFLGELTIAGNTVVGAAEIGIAATGTLTVPSTQDGALLAGFFTTAGALRVLRNQVSAARGQGIVVSGEAVVTDNMVTATQRVDGANGVTLSDAPPGEAGGHGQVVGNRIAGFGGAGISVQAPLASVLVKLNTVRDCGQGILTQVRGDVGDVSIDNNHILDLGRPPPSDGPVTGVLAGGLTVVRPGLGTIFGVPTMAAIRVAGASAGTVAGNIVDGVGASDEGSLSRVGVLLVSCGEVQVSGNVIGRVGPDGQFGGVALGIGVAIPQDTAAVTGNIVRNGSGTGGGPPQVRPAWRALTVSGAGSASTNREASGAVPFGYRLAQVNDKVEVGFTGDWAYLRAVSEEHAMVSGNTLHGGGREPAAVVEVAGDVLLQGNWCVQPEDAQPAVQLTGATASVADNRLRGGKPSMVVTVSPDAAVILGNLNSGGITVGATAPGTPAENTGKPWSQLNPRVA